MHRGTVGRARGGIRIVLRDAADGIYTLPLFPSPPAVAGSGAGVVYTKPWVAELLLNLSGYDADADFALRRAVEPAAGDGAFALPMVERHPGCAAAITCLMRRSSPEPIWS